MFLCREIVNVFLRFGVCVVFLGIRYCLMLEKEGGIDIMMELINNLGIDGNVVSIVEKILVFGKGSFV